MRTHTGRATGAVLSLLLGVLLLAGCGDLTVPDYNNPSLEDLRTNPTPAAVRAAATGLQIGARSNIAEPNAYISLLGTLGRESYNLDPSDPRFITEMLIGPLNPSGAFGGNLWALRYRNIQNAVLVLNAVEQVAESEISSTEKEAIRGYAKTMMALDLLLVINSRDANGAVIDVDRPLSEGPGDLVGRDAVLSRVAALLDEAAAHLAAGGSSFPFAFSSGFSGFDTPATFLTFNRALKARTEVYRRDYPAALAALQASFVSRSAPLDLGVYHVFGTGAGETPNGLVASTIYAHPSILANAQSQPGGALDLRAQEKVVEVEPVTVQGVTTNLRFTIYDDPTDPIPVITNEELLLLRAEALWFTNRKAEALADLNFVRSEAGGLAPIAMPASDEAFVTALLYERFYSLLFEGHRWIDMRRFGRLDQLPKALPTHTVQARFPIPEAECLARGQSTPCGVT